MSTTRPVPAPTRPTTAPPAPAPARATAPPPAPARDCPATLDGTRGHVARAGYHLANRFGIPTSSIGGVAQRAGASDHPAGYALDFMVGRAVGDDLAAYALAHREELAVTYVIWRQRYNDGSGWDAMDDRGTATANHMDHVHISFGRTPPPGGGLPC